MGTGQEEEHSGGETLWDSPAHGGLASHRPGPAGPAAAAEGLAATPRGPSTTAERVEEADVRVQAGQAEAAAQVVEEAQGAQPQPCLLAQAGSVEHEHGAG